VAPLLKHRSRHVADDAGAIPQNFLAWIPRRGLGQEGGGRGWRTRGEPSRGIICRYRSSAAIKTGSGLSVTRIRRRCSGKQLRTARSRLVTRA